MLSRSSVSSLFAVVTVTLLSQSPAFAGAGSGGGGDPRCSEYSNLMGEIVKSLAIAGQDKISAVNPLVRLDDLVKVKRNLKCLPVKELDREARSYPADGHTDLLVSEWEKQDLNQKINLTAHEMSVLATYENDGEYYISEDLVKIVRASSKSINAQMSAEQVVENVDGSVTLDHPFAMIEGQKIYFGIEANISRSNLTMFGSLVPKKQGFARPAQDEAEGVCKYLGYQGVLDNALSNEGRYTYVDASPDGHLLGLKTKSETVYDKAGPYMVTEYEVHTFQSITCK